MKQKIIRLDIFSDIIDVCTDIYLENNSLMVWIRNEKMKTPSYIKMQRTIRDHLSIVSKWK